MDVPDFLLKVGGLAATASLSYLAFVKHRVDSRASAASTEGQLLDNYTKLSDRLTLYETRMATMRSQLDQQSDIIEQQSDEIGELNKASERHSNEMAQATKDVVDYKGKYEETKSGLDECRASCQEQAAALRKLEAVLTAHGLLTPDVEADLERVLTPPAAPDPPPAAALPPPDPLANLPNV